MVWAALLISPCGLAKPGVKWIRVRTLFTFGRQCERKMEVGQHFADLFVLSKCVRCPLDIDVNSNSRDMRQRFSESDSGLQPLLWLHAVLVGHVENPDP